MTFNLGEWMVFLEAAFIVHVDIDGATGGAAVVEGSTHHQVISPENENSKLLTHELLTMMLLVFFTVTPFFLSSNGVGLLHLPSHITPSAHPLSLHC